MEVLNKPSQNEILRSQMSLQLLGYLHSYLWLEHVVVPQTPLPLVGKKVLMATSMKSKYTQTPSKYPLFRCHSWQSLSTDLCLKD